MIVYSAFGQELPVGRAGIFGESSGTLAQPGAAVVAAVWCTVAAAGCAAGLVGVVWARSGVAVMAIRIAGIRILQTVYAEGPLKRCLAAICS